MDGASSGPAALWKRRFAIGAGARAHVLVGDARVLVERLLVAEGLRALRALERLLAKVHRLEVGPHDAGREKSLEH